MEDIVFVTQQLTSSQVAHKEKIGRIASHVFVVLLWFRSGKFRARCLVFPLFGLQPHPALPRMFDCFSLHVHSPSFPLVVEETGVLASLQFHPRVAHMVKSCAISPAFTEDMFGFLVRTRPTGQKTARHSIA